jgi:dipeptidyl aminopeptidase/acylaminoacyl peptidase
VAPETLAFKGRGGTDIDAWYYPAVGALRPQPRTVPLILSIRDGARETYGYGFNAEVQAQAARGYATLVVLSRSGFAGGASDDLIEALDHLLTMKPEIDVDRLGVTGTHDSGIMNRMLTESRRFKAAVSTSPHSNTPSPAPASSATTPTLIVHELEDPANDLDRMEQTLAWFDRHLRTGTRPSASRQ